MGKKTKLSEYFLAVVAGFAMFAMFFGSGNLVFPLTLGSIVDGHYVFATIGLLLTGVLLPFMGLYAILLFNGSYTRFFMKIGKGPAFWLPFIMLMLLGPFGVIARCITVAHGSFVTVFPNTPLWLFSLIMVLVIYFLVLDRNKITPMLGALLNPLLLISLTAIIGFALFEDVSTQTLSESTAMLSLSSGFIHGYWTMDLIAAFFFANFIIRYVENTVGSRIECELKEQRIIMQAMLIAATLLALIYAAFVYLGIKYTKHLSFENAEQSLGIIAQISLGEYAAPIVTVAVILACITTAAALATISGSFLQQKVTACRLGYELAILIILLLSFAVSNFEFSGIAVFLRPILKVLYSAIIVLTVITILRKRLSRHFIRGSFYLTLLGTIFYVGLY